MAYLPPDPQDERRWREMRENARRWKDKQRGLQWGDEKYRDPAGAAYDERGVTAEPDVSEFFRYDEELKRRDNQAVPPSTHTTGVMPAEPRQPSVADSLDRVASEERQARNFNPFGLNTDVGTRRRLPEPASPFAQPAAPMEPNREGTPIRNTNADQNFGERVGLSALGMIANPYRTAIDMGAAPVESLGKVVRYAGRKIGTPRINGGESLSEWNLQDRPSPPEGPDVTGAEAFQAAMQVGAIATAGPFARGLARFGLDALGPVETFRAARHASLAANVASHGAAGAGVGVTYGHGDVGVAAALGGAMGAVAGAATPGPGVLVGRRSPQLLTGQVMGPPSAKYAPEAGPEAPPDAPRTEFVDIGRASPETAVQTWRAERVQNPYRRFGIPDAPSVGPVPTGPVPPRAGDIPASTMPVGRTSPWAPPAQPSGPPIPMRAPQSRSRYSNPTPAEVIVNRDQRQADENARREQAAQAEFKQAIRDRKRYEVTVEYEHKDEKGNVTPRTHTMYVNDLRMADKLRQAQGKGWSPFYLKKEGGTTRINTVNINDRQAIPKEPQVPAPTEAPAPAEPLATPESPRQVAPPQRLYGFDGAETTVQLPNGESLPARYRIVSAKQLQASHDPFSFTPNEKALEGAQGRDYSRDVAAQDHVKKVALEYDHRRALNPTESAIEGPPVVIGNGVIIGHGRQMALMRAMTDAPEKAAAYFKRTTDPRVLKKFGIAPTFSGMPTDPVLIRELVNPADVEGGPQRWHAINQASDQNVAKTKSAVDDAVARSFALSRSPDALKHLAETLNPEETMSEYLGRADGRKFFDEVVRTGVFRPEELAAIQDKGVLTQEGRDKVAGMLRMAAIGDPTALLDAPRSVVEKIDHVVPAIVKLNNTAYGLSEPIAQAFRLLARAQQQGMKVEQLSGQMGLLAGDEVSPLVAHLAKFLRDEKRETVKKAFRQYGIDADFALTRKTQPDLMGDTGLTPRQAFDKAFGYEGPSELETPSLRRTTNIDVFKYGLEALRWDKDYRRQSSPLEQVEMEIEDVRDLAKNHPETNYEGRLLRLEQERKRLRGPSFEVNPEDERVIDPDMLIDAIGSAPAIPNTQAVVVPDVPGTAELAKSIAQSTWSRSVSEAVTRAISSIWYEITSYEKLNDLQAKGFQLKKSSAYGKFAFPSFGDEAAVPGHRPQFTGLGLHSGYFAFNFWGIAQLAEKLPKQHPARRFVGSRSQIVFQPYTTYYFADEAVFLAEQERGAPLPERETTFTKEELAAFVRGESKLASFEEAVADAWANHAFATVVHEVVHQWEPSHDVRFKQLEQMALFAMEQATSKDQVMRDLRRAAMHIVASPDFYKSFKELRNAWTAEKGAQAANGTGPAASRVPEGILSGERDARVPRQLAGERGSVPSDRSGPTGGVREGPSDNERSVGPSLRRTDDDLFGPIGRGRRVSEPAPPAGAQGDLFAPPPKKASINDLDRAHIEVMKQRILDTAFYSGRSAMRDRDGAAEEVVDTFIRYLERNVGKFDSDTFEDVVEDWVQDEISSEKDMPAGDYERAYGPRAAKRRSNPRNAIVRDVAEQLLSQKREFTGTPTPGELKTAEEELRRNQLNRPITAEEMASRRDELGFKKSPTEGTTGPDQRTIFDSNTGSRRPRQDVKDDEAFEDLANARAAATSPLPMPSPAGFADTRGVLNALANVKPFVGKTVFATQEVNGRKTAATGRMALAQAKRQAHVIHAAFKPWMDKVEKLPRAQQIQLIDDYENGREIADPELAAGMRVFARETEKATKDLLKYGVLRPDKVIENYVTHFWSKPKNPVQQAFVASLFQRIPLSGPKNFAKKRSVLRFTDGLRAGLIPATYNVFEMQEARLKEMLLAVAAAKWLTVEQAAGRAKKILDMSTDMPVPYDPVTGERWVTPGQLNKQGDDPLLTIFGPSKFSFERKEGFDANQRAQLYEVIRDWSIQHKRSLKDKHAGDTTWGYASRAKEMWTRFGGDNSVIAHELGHLTEWVSNAWDAMHPPAEMETVELKRGKNKGQTVTRKKARDEAEAALLKAYDQELRDLADQRDAYYLPEDEAKAEWVKQQANIKKALENEVKSAESVLAKGVDSKGKPLAKGQITRLTNAIAKAKEKIAVPTPEMPKGWRPIRHGGPSRVGYLHNREEKMANAIHALMFTPQLMDVVAPSVKAKLTEIFGKDPILKKLLDVQGSLRLGVATIEEPFEYPGQHIVGHWYMPRGSAQIFANRLERGFSGNPLYDLWMNVSRAFIQSLLGISGFHAHTIATEGVFSMFGQSIAELTTPGGEPKWALKYLARSLAQPVSGAAFGRKLMQEYQKPGTHPELTQAVNMLVKAGYQEPFSGDWFKGDRWMRLKKNVKEVLEGDRNLNRALTALGLPLDIAFATIELFATPTLGKYVPWMKMAADHSLIQQVLRLNPDAQPMEVLQELNRQVNQGDARFGEVIYDNYFIKSWAKHLAQALVMATGWTAGTQFLYHAGMYEAGKAPVDMAKWAAGGKTPRQGEPKVKSQDPLTGETEWYEGLRRPVIGDSLIYGVAATMMFMLYNAVWNWWRWGNLEDWKDLFSVRTGVLDEMGNENRHIIPGYIMKDFYHTLMAEKDILTKGSFGKLFKMMGNKLNPVIAAGNKLRANRDFFGNLIVDPDAEGSEKAKQLVKGYVGQMKPISIQNMQENKRRGEEQTAGGLFNVVSGVAPASREFVRTPAQTKMMEYLSRTPHTAMTPDQVEQQQELVDIRMMLNEAQKAGDKETIDRLTTALFDRGAAGTSSITQIRRSFSRNAMDDMYTRRFRRLTTKQAREVWKLMSDDERRRMAIPMQIHDANEAKNYPQRPPVWTVPPEMLRNQP